MFGLSLCLVDFSVGVVAFVNGLSRISNFPFKTFFRTWRFCLALPYTEMFQSNIWSLFSALKKRLASQFNFTYRYIDDVLSNNNRDFENYLGQMYYPELEIKDTTESNTSASTLICSCQSVGTVNFALPFTTNVTISISILQNFRSWVATSHLRPPMAFLSHNSTNTPALAPLMNVLFWGRCDFPISFPGRDMSRNVWNRL